MLLKSLLFLLWIPGYLRATDEHGNNPAFLYKIQAPACSVSLDGWNYGYDSLLRDMDVWRASPRASVESIGSSPEGRRLWMLTIAAGTGPIAKQGLAGNAPVEKKHRIMIHARTHPREVQSSYVAKEITEFLLGASDTAREILQDFIFNIVPMLNPDGVEKGCERVNANGIDLEGNFGSSKPQPEVHSLKSIFKQLMESPSPIRVALNLHSSVNLCRRFFYFHHANGTSEKFAELEKTFIGYVRGHFPGGMEPWDYRVSWTRGTSTIYPESWFWLNHGEAVMALTYEDMNCQGAGDFDKTARALVLGSVDYIRLYPDAALSVKRRLPGHAPPSLGLTVRHSGIIISRSRVGTNNVFDLQGRKLPLPKVR